MSGIEYHYVLTLQWVDSAGRSRHYTALGVVVSEATNPRTSEGVCNQVIKEVCLDLDIPLTAFAVLHWSIHPNQLT